MFKICLQLEDASADVRDTDTDRESLCVISSTKLLYSDGWHNLDKVYGQQFYHHPFRIAQQHQGSKTHLQVRNLLSLVPLIHNMGSSILTQMTSILGFYSNDCYRRVNVGNAVQTLIKTFHTLVWPY